MLIKVELDRYPVFSQKLGVISLSKRQNDLSILHESMIDTMFRWNPCHILYKIQHSRTTLAQTLSHISTPITTTQQSINKKKQAI